MKKINSNLYLEEKYFINEKNFFLKNSWFLAGHISDFLTENDFKTIQLFDQSVIIYKLKNKLRAFTNVCLHRGNIIKTKSRGNEPFVCQYHGWSYNEYGQPKNIPFKDKCFKISHAIIKKLKLNSWNIEFCGNFVFISNSKNKKSLKNYLGVEFNIVKKISYKIFHFVSSSKYVWNANWKICVENSIDEYHAPFLHQTTFKKTLKLNPKYYGTKNVMLVEMPQTEPYIKAIKKINTLFKTENADDNYSHALIFPLSTIASSSGKSFYLQRYVPLSENKTLITTEIYLPQLSKNKNSENLRKSFINACKIFNEKVFSEDKIICENVQKGISQEKINVNVLIGKFEKRIPTFRKKIYNILS